MTGPLVLVHTAAAHVATFDALAAELAPGLVLRHVVEESWLEAATAAGGVTPELHERGRELLLAAAAGAGAALCTCSTLGPCAEAAERASAARILRVDRAMAEAAIACGRRVLGGACLAATLAPTRRLLERVADEAGRPLAIRELLLAEAWPRFLAGDRSGYAMAIAEGLRQGLGDAEVVVLAQASMAPATELLAELGVPVLSSPRLGLAAALAAYAGEATPCS